MLDQLGSQSHVPGDGQDHRGKVEVPPAQANPPPTPDPEEAQISDLLDNSDLALDNSDLGLFS